MIVTDNTNYKLKILLIKISILSILIGLGLGINSPNHILIYCIAISISIISYCIYIGISRSQSNQVIENPEKKFDIYKKKYNNNNIILKKNTICTICLEEINEDCFNYKNCNHSYHEDCLKTWLEIKKVCPNCRIPYP